MTKCRTLEPDWFADLPTAAVNAMDGIANPGSVWPENPNCIYQGGFGIGPMNPVKAFDTKLGLWVRSLAISDGKQTLVLTVIDGEGWLWDYRSKCTDCGAKQIAQSLAADPALKARHVTAASHILHATPLARRAGVHRRLGLRPQLVHGPGHRHHQGHGEAGRPVDAARHARGRRGRGARVQQRAPGHLPVRRGAADHLAASDLQRQGPQGHRDDGRLRRPPDVGGQQQRGRPPRLGRPVREDASRSGSAGSGSTS